MKKQFKELKQGETSRFVLDGRVVVKKIANLLNVNLSPLDREGEKNINSTSLKAIIDETRCIGCSKCVQLCPVGAIVGTARTVHTVIEGYCTGCNLCVSPCPTQCISLRTIKIATDT